MATDGRDPFPLFHLANLDFTASNSTIPDLPSYQLALAPWSAECTSRFFARLYFRL